jgi:hypothetical protein
MARRGGISGDEIRREQEASRQRSRLGGRGVARPLEPSLAIIVTGLEVDWLMPLATCATLGLGKMGLVLAAVAFGVDFFSSTIVEIWRDDDGVHARIRKLWQGRARARHVSLGAARLRYWNAWLCRGLELTGPNVSVTASYRRGPWLRPPLGVPAVSVRLRFRPTLRSFALNLPNIAVNAVTIATVWGVAPYSPLIALVALNSSVSSLANCLLGGPELRVAAPELLSPTRDPSAQPV